ncbi:hypothetical protein NL676_035067 [Syzygium grande]|nr:hypothetical protein NL676_035067 [Syzygium grande]
MSLHGMQLNDLAAVIGHAFTNCGMNNGGRFTGCAGLLGLARDRISLLEQSKDQIRPIILVLPPPFDKLHGVLNLRQGQRDIHLSPLHADINGLTEFNLLRHQHNRNQCRRQTAPYSVDRVLKCWHDIDSGTTVTQLPPTLYSALRSAFQQAMSKYKMSALASPFDTCYDLSGSTMVTVPVITFSFKGPIAVDLDPSGVLFPVNPSKVCLAFASRPADSDLSIYGNIQQRSFEVVSDIAGGRIGFGAKGCS